MRTLALFCGTCQLAYPSHPSLPSGLSLTRLVTLAYSSTPALPSFLRSASSFELVANSSAAARMSSRREKLVSSLSERKKVAAVVFSTPSLVRERLPYHQRPCAQARDDSAELAGVDANCGSTHDKEGEHDTEDDGVHAHHPPHVV